MSNLQTDITPDASDLEGSEIHGDDYCPLAACLECFCDDCVAKMTDEQVALLEADVCPYCNYELQKEKI